MIYNIQDEFEDLESALELLILETLAEHLNTIHVPLIVFLR